MTQVSTYPLRLPKSVKAAAEQVARDEGISLNQFVATAVAEKLSALNRTFLRRASRACRPAGAQGPADPYRGRRAPVG